MIIYCNNTVLSDKVVKADNFFKRLIGLMGKKELSKGESLFLIRCSSIHSLFMRFPIDVIYLSVDKKVLFVETLKPWRIGSLIKGTKHIIELPKGTANQISIGDQIIID